MILTTTVNHSLEMDLAGAVSATELDFVVCSTHISATGRENYKVEHGVSTGTTAKTISAAPAGNGEVHKIVYIAIYNADSATATVTVQFKDDTTVRFMVKQAVPAGQTLCYNNSNGWYII